MIYIMIGQTDISVTNVVHCNVVSGTTGGDIRRGKK